MKLGLLDGASTLLYQRPGILCSYMLRYECSFGKLEDATLGLNALSWKGLTWSALWCTGSQYKSVHVRHMLRARKYAYASS